MHVGDLATTMLDLVGSEHRGSLHLGGADGVSRYEFARLIVGARGGNPDSIRSASFRERGLIRPADCRLGSSRTHPLRGVREMLS